MKFSRIKRMKWISLPLLSLAGVVLTVPLNMGGCGQAMEAIGGAIGGPEGQLLAAGGKAADALTLSEAQEDGMGQTVALAVTNQYGIVKDEALNRYVTLVGLTVASASSRPDGNYLFGVVNSPEINAFSGPNGYIFVTKGAIDAMQDESELAGVLAHEIAHVANKDGLKAVQQAGLVEAGMQAGGAVSEELAMFNAASDGLIEVVLKRGYSQEQELKCDRDAVRMLVGAGYDPNGFKNFLARTTGHEGGSHEVMSTHPGKEKRVALVSEEIAKRFTGKNRPAATLKERFAKHTGRKVAAD
jgi:predicted Zn-dependent protease